MAEEEKSGTIIYPPKPAILAALVNTPFEEVKVILMGQDPYHGQGQAHGLSFSVPAGIKFPPSLKNIFKELNTDAQVKAPDCGDLTSWAKQGALLLNTTLTVRTGLPGSHQQKGWETFTDVLLKKLSEEKTGLVFLLWGKFAQSKEVLIDTAKHHVLKAAHPSPFSAYRGFLGCGHFSKTNQLLLNMGKSPIDWNSINAASK
jgi:uracil-DNA glycosylase